MIEPHWAYGVGSAVVLAALSVFFERRWERALAAQMAAEIWRSAEWRVDQRRRALIQRMGRWRYFPGAALRAEIEAERGMAN